MQSGNPQLVAALQVRPPAGGGCLPANAALLGGSSHSNARTYSRRGPFASCASPGVCLNVVEAQCLALGVEAGCRRPLAPPPPGAQKSLNRLVGSSSGYIESLPKAVQVRLWVGTAGQQRARLQAAAIKGY